MISRFDFHNGHTGAGIEVCIWLKPHSQEPVDLKARLFDKLSKWVVKRTQEHPIAIEPLTIDPTTTQLPEHEELLAVRFRAEWDDQEQVAHVDHSIQDEAGNTVGSFSSEYKRLVDFRLFPARRSPLQQLSLARRSLLSRTLDDREINVALRGLLGALEAAKGDLLSAPGVAGLLDRLGRLAAPELIRNWSRGTRGQFTLTFLNSDVGRLRTATSLGTPFHRPDDASGHIGDDLVLPLEYHGEGLQNALLLLSICDMVSSSQARSIVVIEEPEQHLEPSLCRCIAAGLGRVHQHSMRPTGVRESDDNQAASQSSGQGPLHVEPNQVFITTHSPTLVGELRGADGLLLLPTKKPHSGDEPIRTLAGCNLSQATRKCFERERDRYALALLARHVLVVEGGSEVGLLPVAFGYGAEGAPQDDPFYLGLELVNARSREETLKHARCLDEFGREVHVLIDHDRAEKGVKSTALLLEEGRQAGYAMYCWAEGSLLSFTRGTDLETVLVREVPPLVLFEAIKLCYHDAGHPLDQDNWTKALLQIDEPMRSQLPPVLADDLGAFDLSAFAEEDMQRAFLLALLHGPHSCKAVKDMRIIGEHLAASRVIPATVDVLRRRLVRAILGQDGFADDSPYLYDRQ